MNDKPVNINDVIDNAPMNRFRMTIFGLCVFVMMLDGFDTQAVAFVAPSLAAEWNLEPATLGMIFSSALLGAIIGAFGMGIVSDRLGRHRALMLSVTWFGLFNLACAFATSVEMFLVLRFLCGLGLGGVVPNLIALVAEYAPRRRRAMLISIAWAGFALGAVIGGVLAIPLLANFTWHSIFVLGGVLPLLTVPLVALLVPESIKFLNLTAANRSAVAEIMRKVDPAGAYGPGTEFTAAEPALPSSGVGELFRNGRALGSIFLCLALFMSLLLVYLFLNWIPLLLRQSGLSLSNALLGTVIFNLAGILGSIICGFVVDRSGRHAVRILLATYVLAGLAVISIGAAPAEFGPIMATIFLSGFLIIGVQLPLQAVIAAYYPTAIRGTGIGWSQVVGRTGSLFGPLLGGALVGLGLTPSQLFQVSSAAPFLAALSLAIFIIFSRGATTSDAGTEPGAAPQRTS